MMERHYLLSCLCAYTWVATIAPSCKFLEGLTNHEAMISFSYFYFLILHACSFPVASHCMDGDFFRVFRPQGDRRFILEEFGRNKRSFFHFLISSSYFLSMREPQNQEKTRELLLIRREEGKDFMALAEGEKASKARKGVKKNVLFYSSSFSFFLFFFPFLFHLLCF